MLSPMQVLTLGLCAMLCYACASNPYVIGQVSGECGAQHAAALVCAGFESQDVTTGWDGTSIENAGALEHTTAKHHSGSGALHATSRAAESAATVVANFTPVRSGTLYLRGYLYLPADLPTHTMNIFFLGDDPGVDEFFGIDVNLESGAVQVYSPQSDLQRHTGNVTVPRDRWFCFRLSMTVSADRGQVQAFIDDRLALDASNLATLPPAGVRTFRAGIDWSSETASVFEIYMDDLVVDTAPVDCS
jgi:hypothetical protein